MELLWMVLAISIVVGFVFFVLVKYWQRVLAAHSRALWQLSNRVHALEEIENPDFREKIERASPLPLVRVYSFVLQLEDAFWERTLRATPEELAFVRTHGAFLGSVKIEEWRSHSVATVYEVLPQRQPGGWRARSIEVYPTENGAGAGLIMLWELPLGVSRAGSLELPPSLELQVGQGHLRFCVLHGRFDCDYSEGGESLPKPENIFFDVPLDPARLSPFRKDGAAEHTGGVFDFPGKFPGELFGHRDRARGIEWRLCVRDLQRGRASSGWKTWEVISERGAS